MRGSRWVFSLARITLQYRNGSKQTILSPQQTIITCSLSLVLTVCLQVQQQAVH